MMITIMMIAWGIRAISLVILVNMAMPVVIMLVIVVLHCG